MTIKEVCRASGLTKKAVAYYEKCGLLRPGAAANGYRAYTAKDLQRLKEIAVLRALHLPVADIALVLRGPQKPAVLRGVVGRLEGEEEQRRLALDQLKALAGEYDIEGAWSRMHAGADALSVSQRLLRAFPGPFGRFMCLHFGRFLDVPLDTPEKRRAYGAMIDWLDELEPLALTPELQEALEQGLGALEPEQMQQIERDTRAALEDPERFFRENAQWMEHYRQWRASEESAPSAAGALRRAIEDFQRRSGYEGSFLANLRVLSPAYARHCAQLERANEMLLTLQPRWADIADTERS